MNNEFDKLVEMALEPDIRGGRNFSLKSNTISKQFHLSLFIDLYYSKHLPKRKWIDAGLASLAKRGWETSDKTDKLYAMGSEYHLMRFSNRLSTAFKGLAKIHLIDMRRHPTKQNRYEIRIPSWAELKNRELLGDVMSEIF